MNKLIALILAVVALGFLAIPQRVEAAPIVTQDFLFVDGGSFGVVSIDLAKIDQSGNVSDWAKFELFGFTIGASFSFRAEYDPLDLSKGFILMDFDVDDVSAVFVFQGQWDIASGGFMNIFSTDGQLLDAGEFRLGPATVGLSSVSEPATMFLVIAALSGLLLRKRRA